MTYTVYLSKRKNPLMILSWIFRKIEGVPFSHCASCVIEDGVFWIYESTMPKGRKIKLSDWLKINDIVHEYSFNVSSDELYIIKQKLSLVVGKPYSYLQLFTMLLGMMCSAADNFIKYLEFNGDSKLVCTEPIVDILRDIFDVAIYENLDNVSLKESGNYLSWAVQARNKIGFRAYEKNHLMRVV